MNSESVCEETKNQTKPKQEKTKASALMPMDSLDRYHNYLKMLN